MDFHPGFREEPPLRKRTHDQVEGPQTIPEAEEIAKIARWGGHEFREKMGTKEGSKLLADTVSSLSYTSLENISPKGRKVLREHLQLIWARLDDETLPKPAQLHTTIEAIESLTNKLQEAKPAKVTTQFSIDARKLANIDPAQVSGLWRGGHIKVVKDEEGGQILQFSKELAPHIDDGLLAFILRHSAGHNELMLVTGFNFSDYPKLRAQAPLILLKRFTYKAFASIWKAINQNPDQFCDYTLNIPGHPKIPVNRPLIESQMPGWSAFWQAHSLKDPSLNAQAIEDCIHVVSGNPAALQSNDPKRLLAFDRQTRHFGMNCADGIEYKIAKLLYAEGKPEPFIELLTNASKSGDQHFKDAAIAIVMKAAKSENLNANLKLIIEVLKKMQHDKSLRAYLSKVIQSEPLRDLEKALTFFSYSPTETMEDSGPWAKYDDDLLREVISLYLALLPETENHVGALLLNCLIECRSETPDLEKLRGWCESAITLAPDNEDVHSFVQHQFVTAELETHYEPDKIRAAYEAVVFKALDTGKVPPSICFKLAENLRAAGSPATARNMLERYPNDLDCQGLLGWIMYNSGNPDEKQMGYGLLQKAVIGRSAPELLAQRYYEAKAIEYGKR